MNVDTWAVVLATALGPLAAVLITMWRGRVDAVRDRQTNVFSTLMATRRLQISTEHVNALNLIEVEFYRKPTVLAAWKNYIGHLHGGPEDAAWIEKKDKLLAELLSNMAKVLNFKIDGLDIFRSGYAPGGWVHREDRANAAMEFVYQLATRQNTLPVLLVQGGAMPGPPAPPPPVGYPAPLPSPEVP